MKVVFLGTAEFAVPCLEALYREGHQIVAVITQPDRPRGRGKKLTPTPVKQKALTLGLEILQPEKIKDREIIKKLTDLAPDLLIVVAYGQLLPEPLLTLAPHGCINVHASLLPKYRGGAPIHRAIMAGEKETGVTTMYVSKTLDAGDIILQEKKEIDSKMTTGELHDQLAKIGSDLLLKTIEQISKGVAPRIPQNHWEATYAPLLTREDEKIIWNKNAEEIVNLIRGLNPWPGSYTRWENKNIKIWESRLYDDGKLTGVPGEIIQANENGVLVVAGDGKGVLIKKLQMQGRRPLTVAEFLNGYQMTPGQVFIS